jgi:hypothetical protein
VKRLILILVLSIIILFFVSCNWVILDNSLISNSTEGKLTTSWDIGDTENNGDDWLDIPDEAEIGDTFRGSSGQVYELQEENLASGEEEYYNSWGLDCSGIWVEIIMSNN